MTNEGRATSGHNLSHGQAALPFEQFLTLKRDEIAARGDLPDATVAEQLNLLDQLAGFPFGRFFLVNRGWNGSWTDFVMQHPTLGHALTPLEQRLLDTFPMILATRERSRHFAAAIQDRIVDGHVLASIPCGLMRDLLGRDYSATSDIRLVGIDIDDESLSGAQQLAADCNLSASVTFHRSDAWAFGYREAFDLIASNGLNTYEPDDGRVTDLYRGFHSALKPGGALITSFMTPPPEVDADSEWNMDAIDAEALRLQRTVFIDIVGVSFQCYRSSTRTIIQLLEAGFSTVELIWDRAHIYPAVIATKAE